MSKKRFENTIHSSVAEYLTYVASNNEHIKKIYDDELVEAQLFGNSE